MPPSIGCAIIRFQCMVFDSICVPPQFHRMLWVWEKRIVCICTRSNSTAWTFNKKMEESFSVVFIHLLYSFIHLNIHLFIDIIEWIEFMVCLYSTFVPDSYANFLFYWFLFIYLFPMHRQYIPFSSFIPTCRPFANGI